MRRERERDEQVVGTDVDREFGPHAGVPAAEDDPALSLRHAALHRPPSKSTDGKTARRRRREVFVVARRLRLQDITHPAARRYEHRNARA